MGDEGAKWHRYFTPSNVGDTLVGWLQTVTPVRTAVDICAGQGHLLNSVRGRWPNASLTANDISDFEFPSGQGFSKEVVGDGREFAIRSLNMGHDFDLVVANPPFGRAQPFASPYVDLVSGDLRAKELIQSARIETAMLTASGILVGKGGMLAAIVPDTLIFGESYSALRQWLASQFKSFSFQRIPRGSFRNQDLGLTFLAAYKRRVKNCIAGPKFVRPANGSQATRVIIQRGRLISSHTQPTGETPVVHCGGNKADQGYVIRACKNDSDATSSHVWVEAGDFIITRVGRRAGQATVYEGPRAILSDCIFKLSFGSQQHRSTFTEVIQEGILTTQIQECVAGLGARFCTKSTVAQVVCSIIGYSTQTPPSEFDPCRLGDSPDKLDPLAPV